MPRDRPALFTLATAMIAVGAVLLVVGVVDLVRVGDWLALAAGALLVSGGVARRKRTGR